MEDDDNNDGPFSVWQMFNAPILMLFENNIELAADGLDRLLTSILKLSGDFSEVLVPRSCVSKCPDSYYSAFNTWLLGRLFYVCSVKELTRIHTMSKDAQLKIINILCVNAASFHRNLHSQYVLILIKLLEYYKEFPDNEKKILKLENFTPEIVQIPNIDINLNPIYVEVKDITTCKSLINLILQLLSESIPLNLLQTPDNNMENETFTLLLDAIQYFSIDIKYVCLNFFLSLITNMNKMSITKFCYTFRVCYKTLLYSLEAIAQNLNVFYDKCEIDDLLLNNFNVMLLEYIKIIEWDLDIERKQIIMRLCCIILSKTSNRIFNKELKLHCLLLSNKIDMPRDFLNISDMDFCEIEQLAECYSKKILEHIQMSKENNKINILQENWYYSQVISVINSIKSCEQSNTDVYLISYYLQRCHRALAILEIVECKIKRQHHENIKTQEIISMQNVTQLWATLIQIQRQHKSLFVKNQNLYELITNIVLCTVNLGKNFTRDDNSVILSLLCFFEIQSPDKDFLFSDSVKLMILSSLLIGKLHLKPKSDDWDNIISSLYNFLLKRKEALKIREITQLCPLIVLNKVVSTSKIISDIMIHIFMRKEVSVQNEIMVALMPIACMSLGTYNVIISNDENIGHIIYSNNNINLSLVCTKCHKLSEHVSSEAICLQIRKDFKVIHSESNSITPTKISTYDGVRKLFGNFLNMKLCGDNKTFWNLVRCLSNHYCIFNFNVSTEMVNEKYFKEVLVTFKPFMNDTQVLKDPEWIFYRDTILDMCINILANLTKKSLQNNDYSLQCQTLEYIKDLGLCHNSKLILPITKLFIFFIMNPQCSLAPKAVVYLREVSEFKGFTPNQIYHRYKKDICKLFVDCSLYNGKDFIIYLIKVVKAFGFIGYRDFISKDIHHFLPYLMPYATTVKEVPSMIEEIAALVQCTISGLLVERFPHVYVHVYLHESDDVAKKCYAIIEKLTKTSTLSLIKRHFRVILTEFLLQFCTNPEKVLNACKHLASHDPDVSTSQLNMSMSAAQIADFLNPKFLGVLAYFDHKLVNAKVALSVKRKALKSFPDIMQLMGPKYITPLRFKVLATLRSALPLAKEFSKILADAWGAFIYNIDSICLGPLLSNLAVSLLQQFEYAPQEINKIFHYLVLNNENLLSSNIPDLYFVVDSEISERVRTVIKKHVRRTQPEGFLHKIKWYLQQLNHDIPDIKAHAFSHLDKLLRSNRSEINKALFDSKNIDSPIVGLIDTLLVGCKDPNTQVSISSGACLGQLGAIEAGHLPRQYVQDSSPFAFSINDDCFAATALIELTRAFQYEKDTINMDSYALTIQEILKVYDISPTGTKKDLWDSFPENMHQIMFPLLNSRYTLAYPSQPKNAHPLFGSVYATTFLEWAHNWAGQLISVIQCEEMQALLRAVQPSMRRDARTLFLFLPYALLHAVAAAAPAQHVRDEILAVIGLENIQTENTVEVKRSKYKMLRHITMTPNINSVQAEEGNQGKCSKTVYTLLDFLNRWLLEWTHVKPKPLENETYNSIKMFVDSFDKLIIARGNFACGELERALQYLELYMDENKDKMQEHLPLLAEIYALLDEPDSVAGILSIKRSEPSLKELILTQVVTGRLQDAALCYERLAQEGQLDRNSLQGMVDCYLGLDQPFTAYRLLSEPGSDDMKELTAEPLWRLGRFDQLEKLTSESVPTSRENWGLLMGRILLAYRKQDHATFKLSCNDAKVKLLTQMDGQNGGESALKSGYQSVLGLHIITEAVHAEELLTRLKELNDNSDEGTQIINQLLSEWRLRLSVVQSDVRTVEPLLRLRRILLQQAQELLEPTHPITAGNLKTRIGELWLQSAKQARKAGIFQQSYMYILNAEEYNPEELFIEKSKMYWARGQHEHAFTTLRRGLHDVYPEMTALTSEQRKICAKAKLLIAKYNDETTKVDVDVNIGYYKESVEAFKHWEKSLVCLGTYYEKASNNDSTATTSTVWTRRLHALNCYGKALQYGHKYLYQSMPRMLSIWLDVEVTSSDTNIHSVLAKMTDIIKTYSERLPIYLYLTAFSQIVSRICHPVREVYQQLKAIIVKLIIAYPQHTLWMMMCVIKSGYPQRIKRCSDVFSEPCLKQPHMLKLLNDFKQLAEKLIELCNKPITTTGPTTTVSSLVRSLPRLLSSEGFSCVMMPFQQFCKVVVPRHSEPTPTATTPEVYIAGIEDTVTILPSLQKPRKVTLRGSDGKAYIIMLKPRDDLRKDFRLMEFNTVVNRFLQDAPETRRRRLHIRTYSVLPLNEECGIIEWVPNLIGLRPVLLHIYKQKGIHTSNRELKELMCLKKDPYEKKLRIYEEQLLPRHPPVFQEWFRRVFSDPYGWYQARSAYIKTTAVMSMVGYILGLGDRHGENISFDSTNGDTVHVDFNCLFNKGESFEWPERVPFRLTHNMEAAMGPLKHEGMYRRSCAAVMRVLRAQTEALMSVVGPFVYDPLVSWDAAERGERTNPHALHHLAHIRQRLRGMVKTKNKQLSLSLSPEGQVEHLIVEATSVHNLCQMYIGWGPFL